jgi:hypothetical protein
MRMGQDQPHRARERAGRVPCRTKSRMEWSLLRGCRDCAELGLLLKARPVFSSTFCDIQKKVLRPIDICMNTVGCVLCNIQSYI